MPFVNRVRLPFYLSKPQFIEDRTVFPKANGEIKVLSVVIKKQYEGDTDHWPEKLHERFKIALAHDHVSVEGDRYVGNISQDGDYTIDWPDFLDYPIGKAAFKANVTPYNASNSNCGTCDDFTQVVAEDDDIGEVGEGDSISVSVTDNDAVCCYPAVLTIVSVNSDYVQSAVVNGLNIDIQIKTPLTSATDITLLTYRIACDNGQYDEADVIADIAGSVEPTCLQPLNVDVVDVSDSGGVASWDDPVPAPANGYHWELYEVDNPGVPIETGDAISGEYPSLEDLDPGVTYNLCVRSVCGEDDFSEYVCHEFTTLESSEGCGMYRLQPIGHGSSGNVTYMNCSGDYVTVTVTLPQRIICAMENSPGDPVSIEGPASISITYLNPCT